jgi:hypothetical protein
MRSTKSRATRLSALLALVPRRHRGTPAGAQDFSRFVAFGDSLAAGFMSGGLAVHPQERSAPALVARQAGVTDFQQPLISEPGIPPLLALQGFATASRSSSALEPARRAAQPQPAAALQQPGGARLRRQGRLRRSPATC